MVDIFDSRGDERGVLKLEFKFIYLRSVLYLGIAVDAWKFTLSTGLTEVICECIHGTSGGYYAFIFCCNEEVTEFAG